MRTLLVTAALLAAAPAWARDSRSPGLDPADNPARWAVGFMLGDPFGLSLKRYLGAHAWDAYVAFAYGPGLRFGADWLWNGRLERHAKFELDVYAGLGPFIGSFTGPCGPGFFDNRCNGDTYLGARVPLGAEILLREAPVTFGVEIAPGIAFAPGRAGLLLDFLLAVRFLL